MARLLRIFYEQKPFLQHKKTRPEDPPEQKRDGGDRWENLINSGRISLLHMQVNLVARMLRLVIET